MALAATIYQFQIELADVDRSVYETLKLRVAMHPSEDGPRVVTRILARCLFHDPELEFGRGLSMVEDAALWIREDADRVKLWIDVGHPSAERLHRANKRAEKVVVVSDRDAGSLAQQWRGEKIHKADTIVVTLLPSELVRDAADDLDRKNDWVLSRTDGFISLDTGKRCLSGQLEETPLATLQDS